MTSLAPVPSESRTCANCSAPLVDDQRYCLSCGQPVSPVRLAFLDVLESERAPQLAPAQASVAPLAHAPYAEAAGGPAWARRYAPLFALASVLLLALVVGLLLGHWVSQGRAASNAPQVVKIEGLGGLAATAGGGAGATTASGSTTATGSSTTPSSSAAAGAPSSSKSEEAKEEAEARAEEKAEEKAPAKAPPVKNGDAAVGKLEKTTGKKHEEELNKISTAPIEVK